MESIWTMTRLSIASRQTRFVDALQVKATLMFSLANVIEVVGPQGRSANAVRAFLSRIGPHWIPLQLNPWEVMKREQTGPADEAAVSPEFMEAYYRWRLAAAGESNALIDLTQERFFQLEAVVDWVYEERDWIRAQAEALDNGLREMLTALRSRCEQDPTWLDHVLPPCQFNDRYPATFVMVHLQRLLIREAKGYRFKPGDCLDLCHAVIGAAYGSLITLDKQWKRRIEALPTPHNLARTYYRAELERLIEALESPNIQ